jgi:hypothetical protein
MPALLGGPRSHLPATADPVITWRAGSGRSALDTATDKAKTALAWTGGSVRPQRVGTGAAGHAPGLGLHVVVMTVAVPVASILALAVAAGG